MSATTIKIEGKLLSELKKIKGPHRSVSALVRHILESELRRRKMAETAQSYRRFLENNPEEADDLEAWEKAPLDQNYRKKKQ